MWQRPLNRETRGDRPILPTIPQRSADHQEQPVERGEQEGQAHPEESDARVDDEPLHRGVEDTGAGVTTTRNPALRTHTTRIVERTRKRNAVAETHFNQNLSRQMDWYVVYRTVLYDVNTPLLQHATDLLNILHIHAGNANAAIDLAVTVLKNLELECDTVQTKNDFPAQ